MRWKRLLGGIQSSQCLHKKGFILQAEREDGGRGMMKRGSNQNHKGREGLRTEQMTDKQKYGIRSTGNWDDRNVSTPQTLDILGRTFLLWRTKLVHSLVNFINPGKSLLFTALRPSQMSPSCGKQLRAYSEILPARQVSSI